MTILDPQQGCHFRKDKINGGSKGIFADTSHNSVGKSMPLWRACAPVWQDVLADGSTNVGSQNWTATKVMWGV